ncbi:hypothetical protein GMLC_31020 [Geomonas limicola]|uniref:Uncharacterized protein n=1 Tax=Geomonas limicola TaxID=2740186 RepID=A0A6V8NDA1_9BACT|nr:hypothetical protein GMLC_31020 [Geomonas limicola]
MEPDRGEALRDLLDWTTRYLDFITGEEALIQEDYARVSARGAKKELQVGYFMELAATTESMAQELRDRVAGFEAVRKQLALNVERQRVLQAEIFDLRSRLGWLRSRDNDPGRPREERRNEARLERKIGSLQSELATLPNVDPEVLQYYTVLVEQGRWQGEWLALKVEEYRALRALAESVPYGEPRDLEELGQAYRRLSRTYQGEISRLNRRIDELDRKREAVNPSGTPGELDRARNLIDLYERLHQRYDRRVRELKGLVGACDAELSELHSLQR